MIYYYICIHIGGCVCLKIGCTTKNSLRSIRIMMIHRWILMILCSSIFRHTLLFLGSSDFIWLQFFFPWLNSISWRPLLCLVDIVCVIIKLLTSLANLGATKFRPEEDVTGNVGKHMETSKVMEVPLNHPFLDGLFHDINHPANLGIPHWWKPPHVNSIHRWLG